MRPRPFRLVPPAPEIFWRLPRHFHACYTSPAPQDGFMPFMRSALWYRVSRDVRVLNSLAASRRSALRAVACQAVVGVLVSLAFLVQGPLSAASAGIAGGALASGSAFAAVMALGGVVSAQVAFARLLLGMLVKWFAVLVAFVVALGVWRLPPLPMLVGLVVGMLVYSMTINGLGPFRLVAGHAEKTKD